MSAVDSLTALFGPVIHRYTRAQALADGVLIDVSDTAREAGITLPVALTQRLWAEWIVPHEDDRALCQSESGRLWDVLWMLTVAIRQQPDTANASRLTYEVLFRRGARLECVTLEAVCGPGDEAEPVITVMLPGED